MAPVLVTRGQHGGATHSAPYRSSIDSMDSSFTLTVDWLAFTVLASNLQEAMKVLGG